MLTITIIKNPKLIIIRIQKVLLEWFESMKKKKVIIIGDVISKNDFDFQS